MAYLSTSELKELGFAYIGKNVKISDKASLYNCDQISIDDNSRIDDFCIVSGKVKIGKYCHITPYCLVAGGIKGIEMEDYATLAYRVNVFAQTDDYSGSSMVNSLIPKKFKTETFAKVSIGKHVIIGTGSTIMPGVTVSEGCSVGAMSLITKATSPWGIYAGIPAKRIKERKRDILNIEQEFLMEINQ